MSVEIWNDCFGEIVGGHIDGQTFRKIYHVTVVCNGSHFSGLDFTFLHICYPFAANAGDSKTDGRLNNVRVRLRELKRHGQEWVLYSKIYIV